MSDSALTSGSDPILASPILASSSMGSEGEGLSSFDRPWGKLTILETGDHYRIKRVEINPGAQMTLHIHHHRSEHWIVVAGTVLVVCNDSETLVTAGMSTYVPPCSPHRLLNPGMIPAQLVEIQNGEYLGEDDMKVLDFGAYSPSL